MNIQRKNLIPGHQQTFFPQHGEASSPGKHALKEIKKQSQELQDLFSNQDNTLWDSNPNPNEVTLAKYQSEDGSVVSGHLKSDGSLQSSKGDGEPMGFTTYTEVSTSEDGSKNHFSYEDPGMYEVMSYYSLATEHVDGRITMESGQVGRGFFEDIGKWNLS